MATSESRILSIDIDCPFERANAFLSRPETFPQWAAGLAEGLEQRDGRWLARTPVGEVEIRFTAPNPYGVLDHTVFPPGVRPVYVPMRVVPNGTGCQVMLSLFREAGWSDQKFAADLELVQRDLKALKELLER